MSCLELHIPLQGLAPIDLKVLLRLLEQLSHLTGLMSGSQTSSRSEKTPRTTQYLSQATDWCGVPDRTACREEKAG